MKKLLFVGALLIVGATAFGAVTQELRSAANIENLTGSDLIGEATLRLTTRGTVIDPTGKAVLVLTPTVNAGPDGESLSFDFGSLVIGQSQSLIGKFTAQVVTSDDAGGVEALPFGNATVLISLAKDVTDGTLTGTSNLTGLKLLDTATGNEMGALGYQLQSTKTNSSTYTGEVIATADPDGEGSFINKDGKVTVSVSAFSFNPAP